MRCKSCDYLISKYARCCPMCGRAVETQIVPIFENRNAGTRRDSLLGYVRRIFGHSRSLKTNSA